MKTPLWFSRKDWPDSPRLTEEIRKNNRDAIIIFVMFLVAFSLLIISIPNGAAIDEKAKVYQNELLWWVYENKLLVGVFFILLGIIGCAWKASRKL